jgi:coenzyme F420-reducing hydrogenase delta subunit
LLEQIGLQGRRVQMINLSSAMGGQFAFSIAELTAEIKQMGANPLWNGERVTRNEESLALRPDS